MMRRNGTISDRILDIFGAIACIALAYLSFQQLIMPLEWSEDYSEWELLIMTALYILVLVAALMAIKIIPDRMLSVLVAAMLVCACLAQIYIVHEIQARPYIDLSHIVNQNRELVNNGEHYFTDVEQFSLYPNNIPLAIVIYWVYRLAAFLGRTDYEFAGGLFNVAMNMLTYICSYRIVRRYRGHRTSVMFLFFLITNLTLYGYASYYYTDTVSLGMTMAAVDLFLTGESTENRYKRTILLSASGFMTLLAFRIRATSIFIVVAALVYVILRVQYRRVIRVALPVIAGVIIASACYSGLYHYHVNFDTTDTAAPWQHWVAMAANLETGGAYNEQDVAETQAQPDHQSKVDYNVEKWKSRVLDNGLVGNIELILNKEKHVWSYGCKLYFVYLELVKDQRPLYDWMVGDKSHYFKHMMMAQNLIMLTLMLASTAVTFIRGKRGDDRTYS